MSGGPQVNRTLGKADSHFDHVEVAIGAKISCCVLSAADTAFCETRISRELARVRILHVALAVIRSRTPLAGWLADKKKSSDPGLNGLPPCPHPSEGVSNNNNNINHLRVLFLSFERFKKPVSS